MIEGAEEEEIIEKIKKSETRDNKIVKVVKEMEKAGIKVLRKNEWHIKDDLVLKKGKMYVPKNCYNSKTLEWVNEEKSCIRVKHKRTQ